MTSTHPTSTTSDPSRTRPPLHGDEERLFISHSNRLRIVVSRNVNTNAANVEDGCAFAWLQLIVKQPRRDTVFSWLTKVAIRHAIRLDKPRRRWDAELDDQTVFGGRSAEVEVEERIVLCETLEQLTGIHERKRQMLVMHATGFSYREIADEAGISVPRARELVYQARLQLRQRMGLDGVDPRSRK
jgi:RNA polymerase sigma factor (sigma-70 family)